MRSRGPRSSSARGSLPPLSDQAARLWLDFGAFGEGPVRLVEIFGAAPLIELEIGCGNGRFLARAASERTDARFLGIERQRSYAAMTAERLAKAGCANARAGSIEAEELLERLDPQASLAAIHIYFSDPWPKRRHTKRRVFNWPFLGQLARAARPGGSIFVKTDVPWYYADIHSLFVEHPAFDLVEYGEQIEFPEEDRAMTGFESKAKRLGRRVFHLTALRREERPLSP